MMKQIVSKKTMKNPVFLGVLFFVIVFLVGAVIPNKYSLGGFLEILIAVIIISYGYASTFKKPFSKEQKKTMSVIFFIGSAVITLLLIAVLEGTLEFSAATLLVLVFLAFVSFIVYLLLGSFSNTFCRSIKAKNKKK